MTAIGQSASGAGWGRQASFVQPRKPAFWLYLGLLLIGGSIFADEQQLYLERLPTAFLLSWAMLLVYAAPMGLLIYRLDLFEHEPRPLIAAALVWGGVIATSLAGQANDAWLQVVAKLVPPSLAADWGAAIVGPGVEETLKLLGVVTIFLIARSEIDGLLDGFVYGAMVGLGFTVVEDVSYFVGAVATGIQAGSGQVDQVGPVVQLFLIRVVAGGLYGHVLYTGLTGIGLAYLVTHPERPLVRRLPPAVLAIAAGVAAHAIWNSPLFQSILTSEGEPSTIQWIAYGTVKGLPFLLILGVILALATRREDVAFEAAMAGEVGGDVISRDELASLTTLLRRRAARRRAGRSQGPGAERLVAQLQRGQIDFALLRTRGGSAAELERQRALIRAIRAQLAAVGSGGPAAVGSGGPAAVAVQGAAGKGSYAGPPSLPAWSPTHLVPAGGLPAWAAPDPRLPPFVVLSAGLDLVVDAWAGDWALVRAVNGWRGWVDGRRLVVRRG